MASPTQWTWVRVNSGNWWWTGRPGMLRFMGSQRVGHNWVTELNILLCISTTAFLSICLLMDIWLLPCPGYYKQCCDEHWGTHASFNSGFLSVYAQLYHIWNEQPVQVRCMILDAWRWCTETTQRDGMEREKGGLFRTGNTCMPVADSCWCMAKSMQYCKVNNNNYKIK